MFREDVLYAPAITNQNENEIFIQAMNAHNAAMRSPGFLGNVID